MSNIQKSIKSAAEMSKNLNTYKVGI